MLGWFQATHVTAKEPDFIIIAKEYLHLLEATIKRAELRQQIALVQAYDYGEDGHV